MRVNGSRHGLKAPITLESFHQPADPFFIPWCAGEQPAWAIGTNMTLRGFRARRLTYPIRVLDIPPEFVIPAKAGIHALTSRERTPTAIPPPTSTRRPHFVFPAIARPVPRYATGIQRRCMCGK